MTHTTNARLIDYIHGALSPQEDAAIYAHMEACARCRQEYDAEVSLGEMLRAHAAAQERELPAMLKAKIWEEIRRTRPSAWDRLAWLLRPAVAVPAAAALAAAAYFGTVYVGPHAAPAIAASYYLQDHAALNGTVPFSDRSSETPVDLAASFTADATQ